MVEEPNRLSHVVTRPFRPLGRVDRHFSGRQQSLERRRLNEAEKGKGTMDWDEHDAMIDARELGFRLFGVGGVGCLLVCCRHVPFDCLGDP